MQAKKVLVVEDNPINMELVCDLLEVHGYAVLRAETAEKGLELARGQRPDLVLMDVSLPTMDGLAATRLLKGDGVTGHIPVVALTAHAMKGDRQQALEAGCDEYITKPIDTRQFLRAIERFWDSAAVQEGS